MKLTGLKHRAAVLAAIKRELPNSGFMNLIKTNYIAIDSPGLSLWCVDWNTKYGGTRNVSQLFVDLFESGATGITISKNNVDDLFCPVVLKKYKDNNPANGLENSCVASNISLLRIRYTANGIVISGQGPYPDVTGDLMVGWQFNWPKKQAITPPLNSVEQARKALIAKIVANDYMVPGRFVKSKIQSGLPKGSKTQILIDDSVYSTVKESLFKEFLDFDNTDKLKYIPESRDCDDFARIVRNNAKNIGIGAVGFDRDAPSEHEYSVAVLVKDSFTGKEPALNDLEVFFFEPQIATSHTQVVPGHGHYMDMNALIIV